MPRWLFSCAIAIAANIWRTIAPDAKNGETPGGNWYQLVGSSYDRTIYGFEIQTTPEQDEALIRKYNSSPNVSHFHLVSNNCADFAKGVLNFIIRNPCTAAWSPMSA